MTNEQLALLLMAKVQILEASLEEVKSNLNVLEQQVIENPFYIPGQNEKTCITYPSLQPIYDVIEGIKYEAAFLKGETKHATTSIFRR